MNSRDNLERIFAAAGGIGPYQFDRAAVTVRDIADNLEDLAQYEGTHSFELMIDRQVMRQFNNEIELVLAKIKREEGTFN